MKWRYQVVLFFFCILFAGVVARLFYWQVVRAEELSEMGDKQYGYRITITPKRGEIKTSDGYSIAANKVVYRVFADPKEIKDKTTVARMIAPELQMDEASISALLDIDKYWVSLKTKVSNDTKLSIEKLDLPGIGFEEQTVRFYPEASTAAKLLGFVGKDSNGDDKGYSGLEGYYERQLRGKAGTAIQIHDALGKPILAKMKTSNGETDGRNLVLHVDRAIQFILQQDLKTDMDRFGADEAMAAVMDPKTGGILAMAAYPSFDPRDYQDYSEDSYRDPFISDTYEPGSTFKPLVMAAAIDSGLVNPETQCTICSGPVKIGDYEIKTWNDQYFPNTTMTEVIQHSDNTGMVFTGRLLGLDRMLAYFKKFGIGELTGIDLQGEVAPPVRPRDNWYPIDQATATFGQGISLTPIELLSAFGSIANGGKRMEPHVVAAVETDTGKTISIPPKVLGQPISAQTAKVMTEILVNAVDNGEAKFAKPKGYRMAGKTGTAQIPIDGHYDPKNTISSFIGFAPADDPKFVMLVVYVRPKSSIYGAETAAPTFFSVAKKILTYYGIPPTE